MQGSVRQRARHVRPVVLVAGAVNLAGALAKAVYGELTRSMSMSAVRHHRLGIAGC